MIPALLLKLAGTIFASIICFRTLQVLARMDVKNRSVSYFKWLMFGISYAAMTCAAAGSAIALWEEQVSVGDLVWLAAFAGTIVFDRRKPRRPE